MYKAYQLMVDERERQMEANWEELLRKFKVQRSDDEFWELRYAIRAKQDEVNSLCPNQLCVDGETEPHELCDECFVYWYIGS
jgi:hypothetical protein